MIRTADANGSIAFAQTAVDGRPAELTTRILAFAAESGTNLRTIV